MVSQPECRPYNFVEFTILDIWQDVSQVPAPLYECIWVFLFAIVGILVRIGTLLDLRMCYIEKIPRKVFRKNFS